MPGLNVLIQRGEVCQCLRDKKLFYETDTEETMNDGNVPTGPFWCAQTQSLQGPDGKLVGVEECRRGRSCCEIA